MLGPWRSNGHHDYEMGARINAPEKVLIMQIIKSYKSQSFLLPVLVVHLPFGLYCKTSWTRVSPIRRRHPTLFCFKAHYSRATVILARIEACVSHVDSWLVRNKLKVNRGKTELLILNASHRPRPPIEAIQVSSERIMLVSSARNIGVVFDCRTRHYHM